MNWDLNQKTSNLSLTNQIKKLPQQAGVYLFKGQDDQILYIGKAKNLKNRTLSYLKHDDWKTASIINSSSKIDFITTKNELEAMLLEVKLIQSNQPKFNILLKTGQPFVYIMTTNSKLPELKIVRNKKQKGSYFGPFIEKTHTRKVFNFLIKTFRLKICKKKIEQGCLYYHMGLCAGSCKKDFDVNGYLKRLNLAQKALKQGHEKFLKYLKKQIEFHNEKLEFEKSKELNEYLEAFKSVFASLETDISKEKLRTITTKDIWILTPDKQSLFLFKEKETALKKVIQYYLPHYSQSIPHPLVLRSHLSPSKGDFRRALSSKKILSKDAGPPHSLSPQFLEYFQSYYQSYKNPATILTNFEIAKDQKKLIEKFLKKWHEPCLSKPWKETVIISTPEKDHFANLIKLAQIKTDQEIKRQKSIGKALQTFLKLNIEPRTIDCFDVSHKQGQNMVGSCVRFKDGQPDKKNFRHFKIKTVKGQNDYAALKEIVSRRYHNTKDLPDLILIDGGKGHLNVVKNLFPQAEFASLAKKKETVFSPRIPGGKKLDIKTHVGQILIALRDYTHHFAISYHKKLDSNNKF